MTSETPGEPGSDQPDDPFSAGQTPTPPTPPTPPVPPVPPGFPPPPPAMPPAPLSAQPAQPEQSPPPAVPGRPGMTPPPAQPYGAPQGYGQAGYGMPPGGVAPDNNLVWAILCTVLCCLPLGIVSIVFASQVNSKWALGDVAGAQESARKAKQWAIWGAVAAGLGLLAYLLFFVVVILLGSSSSV